MQDILRDSDVFKNPEHETPKEWENRQTVKIIIQNDKSEIALITNPVHKLFLLPGGGAESDNLEDEAIRESLEETNYHVEIIDEIGKVDELRNRNAKHYSTTCFSAKVIKEGSKDLRTEEEKENDLEVKWFRLNDALKIMSGQVERVEKGEINFYNTAFNVVRDYNFLSKFDFEKTN